MEFDLTIVAALLTIVGYSVNDTVIVSDRIRENMRKNRREPLASVMNRSINETLSRTILTGGTVLPRRPRAVLPRRRDHPRLRLHPPRRRHRRHVLLDLRREPDRALSRPQAPAASQGGRVGGAQRDARGRRAASPMKRTTQRWVLQEADPLSVSAIERELGVRPLLARLLVNRGWHDPAVAAAVLDASLARGLRSPLLFSEMARAAERLLGAVRHGERIAIYGDYDVDGISASTELLLFLRELGCEPLVHIPHRMRDGYGVHVGALRSLRESGARAGRDRGLWRRGARGDRRGFEARSRGDRVRPPPESRPLARRRSPCSTRS